MVHSEFGYGVSMVQPNTLKCLFRTELNHDYSQKTR